MLQSKRFITSVIQLFVKSPWLAARAEALDSLQRECASEEELSLILDLLARYSYISDQDISSGFASMIDQCVNGWALNPHETFICPPKVDSSADSGPAVIQTLKTALGKRGIRGFELSIRLNKLKDFSKSRSTVVVVDDFAGTGSTIEGKLGLIRGHYKETPPRIFVCLLAASHMARERLENQVDGYFAWREFRRGISDHYPPAEAAKAILTMSAMESRLSQAIGKTALPNLGYGNTEVLFGWETNLPNSVFPIFWWPELNCNSARKTLFHRYMGDA